MHDHKATGDKNPGTESSIATNQQPIVRANELTGFQHDILGILAHGREYGLGIKKRLENYYGMSGEGNDVVHHGRLYPNLNDLVDKGLVEKSELDKRTNQYALTGEGRHYVRERAQFWVAHLGVELEDGGGDA